MVAADADVGLHKTYIQHALITVIAGDHDEHGYQMGVVMLVRPINLRHWFYIVNNDETRHLIGN